MDRQEFSVRKKSAACGLLLAAALLAGCATSPESGPAAQWLKLEQAEQRFAIFTNAPVAPADRGLATFRLVYVYMPETVQHQGQYVGWQEYSAMTINCGADTVRTGPRTRYAPDGAVMMSDENQDYAPIIGPSIRKVADIACNGAAPGPVLIPDGPDWIEAARRHIAATNPEG